MENLLSKIKLTVNPHLFIKDPYSSDLGLSIVRNSIDLIDDLGFEDFTFRKLGLVIHSPEASIYRYFESKQKLLLYLGAWYWAWMEYRLILSISNISSAEKRLEKALALMTEELTDYPKDSDFNMVKLSRIVTFESSKSYLTKQVDEINKDGAFLSYKQFVSRVSAVIMEINPCYKYPNMLVSTVIEGAHLQRFYAYHLPKLTNKQKSPNYLKNFFTDLVFNTIKK